MPYLQFIVAALCITSPALFLLPPRCCHHTQTPQPYLRHLPLCQRRLAPFPFCRQDPRFPPAQLPKQRVHHLHLDQLPKQCAQPRLRESSLPVQSLCPDQLPKQRA